MASGTLIPDGSFDFSGGVDSGRVTTVQSPGNPHGLPRYMLAWMTNCTVRSGGILQRTGWQPTIGLLASTGLFQGGFLYEPSFANPYLVVSISGRIYKALLEAPFTVTDLSAAFGLTNPATVPKAYFVQGEQFLVIQAGDLAINNPPTLPLFWDGTTLRRSNGLTGIAGGNVPAVYTLTTAAAWIIPATGATVVVSLTANYPGKVGDKGTWQTTTTGSVQGGTFEVTAIGANSVTLKTVFSPYVGGTFATGLAYTFTTTAPQVGNINELPAATAMCYYQGRIWYAQGRKYAAGDIVDGPSGTLAYQFTDSILKVTENPLAIGGDGFKVPDNAGDIRALAYTSNLNTVLGQGPLYIFTRRQIYQLAVPVTRNDWIAAGAGNTPQQTVAQRRYGTTSDRSVVPVNGDLFYQTPEPAIRSLTVSVRNDAQWGNVPLSRNENRVLDFNDRALMPFATGIEFDNRLLQAVLPVQTLAGVAFQGIIPLDFDIISSFGQEEIKPPPAWEGLYEGINVLQLFEGDFGGRQRAFAAMVSRVDGSIQVWEITDFAKTDNGDNRVPWYFETPAYTWTKEFELKQLAGGEIWLDKISGTIEFQVQYRADADPCWQDWFITQFCAAKSSCEDVDNPVCYPLEPFCEGFKFPITLPEPQGQQCAMLNKRPTNLGYQFQIKVTVKGWCRVRGILLKARPIERSPYAGLNC